MHSQKIRLTGAEKGGVAAVAAGVITLLLVAMFGSEEGFWVIYTDGFRVVGWMVVCVASIWLAFSVARARTSFFDLARRIDADKFGLSIAAIALAVIVALVAILPQLPATDDADLPRDPKARAQVIRVERNLRYYVSTVLVLTGLAVGAFPAIRFFRK